MEIESNIKIKNIDVNLYYKLLKEEDYDFKNKRIEINLEKGDSLKVNIKANSLLEYKIGSSAIINTLYIIEKTLNLLENESI